MSQPNVAMFMEPSASDWHLVELVVKNFGQKPAYGIQFEFASPPTVPRYESADADNYVDIVPLKLPAEIPYLAPSQEWRTVWDSALDRKQLGESIGSRFAGRRDVLRPAEVVAPGKGEGSQRATSSARPRCWTGRTLHPVERLELLTTHDLARQEKQKLELLRGLLTYYHYAATESRQEVLQAEINRINAAANEQRDRYRGQFTVQQETPQRRRTVRTRWRSPSCRRRSRATRTERPQRSSGSRGCRPSYDDPPPPYDDEPPYDDDDARPG